VSRALVPRLAGAGLAALVLAGCNGGIMVQDDFFVQRSGSAPGAALTLVVNDAGTAACNGKAPVPVSDPQLIQARYIQTTIAPQAQAGLTLAAGPRPVFHYYVRTPDGHVSFYDDSPHQPSIFGALTLLTLQIAQADCHLPPA
jgi:catechol 2,3-dioxygenase-like lactoylglutathione lyase family enzyme